MLPRINRELQKEPQHMDLNLDLYETRCKDNSLPQSTYFLLTLMQKMKVLKGLAMT